MTTKAYKLKKIDEGRRTLMDIISKARSELAELGVQRTNMIMED